jgi:hypothetical protein
MILFPKMKKILIRFYYKEKIMKAFRINLQKLISKSEYLNEFSYALTHSEKNGENKKDFTKTFVASGKQPCPVAIHSLNIFREHLAK